MKANNQEFWTAFYTKPRNERKTAERLTAEGYTVYCPVKTVLKQWSDRKKKVKEVLFTSYLFAQVDEQLRMEILKDSGIVSSVFWLKQPVKIPDEEIKAIQRFLDENGGGDIDVERLDVGEEIDIKFGPFKGERGIIEKIKGNKVILSLDSLGLILKAEIPAGQLV